MRRAIAVGFSILALVALVFIPSGAEARKRGGWTIPIIVPGTSSGDTLIKVRDLPKGPPFVDKNGNQIDLGYLWPRRGEPRWVGYVSRTTYYDWSPATLEAVVAESGMGSLPPVPERPGSRLSAAEAGDGLAEPGAAASRSSGGPSFFWILLVGGGAFWLAWKFLFRRRKDWEVEASGGAWVSRAEGRMAGGATAGSGSGHSRGAPGPTVARAQPRVRPAGAPRMAPGVNGRSGFGQRR